MRSQVALRDGLPTSLRPSRGARPAGGTQIFVRALLVVRPGGAYAVTYGVWAGIHPGDLQRAYRVWWEQEYQQSAARSHAC
jgi:hypothetical protein